MTDTVTYLTTCTRCGIRSRTVRTYWDQNIELCTTCCVLEAVRNDRKGWPDMPSTKEAQ